jgi:hypothetical protein
MGVSGETESLTHRELVERRKAIQEKLEGKLDSSLGGSVSDT